MEWFQSILNAENGSAVQLLAITISIVILLILITWIFRKIAGTAARRKSRNRIPRLSVTDWTSVGEKHQLVLVRRDNVEHLLLIGGNSDVVVENNIVRVQSASKPRTETAPATPVQKTEAETPPQSIKAEEEKPADIVTPVVATAAAVTAAATVTADAEPVDTTPDTTEIEADIAEVAAQATEEVIAEIETPAIEAVEAETPVTETVEFESDLIASISETLDDEVQAEAPQPAVETPAASPEVTATESTSGEDEMQRLLDELASETKEVTAKEPA